MKLSLVGTGGSAVGKNRACPCFLVDNDTLIDCGPGALRNLRIMNADLKSIGRILISHPHADHIGDIVPLLWAMQIDGRKMPLKIFGPAGIEDRISSYLRLTDTPDGFLEFPITFMELDGNERFGDTSTCITGHKVKTLAYRVDRGGLGFCYSADTPYSEAVVRLAEKCQVLLHEATFLRDQEDMARMTGHSTASDAGRAARGSAARILVIFHIPPPNEEREHRYYREALEEFDGEVMIGRDLQTIEI